MCLASDWRKQRRHRFLSPPHRPRTRPRSSAGGEGHTVRTKILTLGLSSAASVLAEREGATGRISQSGLPPSPPPPHTTPAAPTASDRWVVGCRATHDGLFDNAIVYLDFTCHLTDISRPQQAQGAARSCPRLPCPALLTPVTPPSHAAPHSHSQREPAACGTLHAGEMTAKRTSRLRPLD